MMPGPNLPLAIEPLALQLVHAALLLAEDANACALNPTPPNFDAMMVSMRTAYEIIQQTFQTIKGDMPLVSTARIQAAVAEAFGVRLRDMVCQTRSRKIARPRQVAMYLARELTTRSLPEIGRAFGDRHHTTVMAAIDRVTGLMSEDEVFRARVASVRASLQLTEDR
jgi:chromosomal replication initiation ATPase DnaA